jgi:hypothetical protein
MIEHSGRGTPPGKTPGKKKPSAEGFQVRQVRA